MGDLLKKVVRGIVNLIVTINATHKPIMEIISLAAPRDIPNSVFTTKIKNIKKSNPFQLSMRHPTSY